MLRGSLGNASAHFELIWLRMRKRNGIFSSVEIWGWKCRACMWCPSIMVSVLSSRGPLDGMGSLGNANSHYALVWLRFRKRNGIFSSVGIWGWKCPACMWCPSIMTSVLLSRGPLDGMGSLGNASARYALHWSGLVANPKTQWDFEQCRDLRLEVFCVHVMPKHNG